MIGSPADPIPSTVPLRAARATLPELLDLVEHGAERTRLRADRECVVTEAWAWPYIEAHARNFTPNALLFDGVRGEAALAKRDAACAAAKLPRSTLHDHRHSYTVTLRRRGISDSLIARQLGHRDTVLVARNYGRFTPDAADFVRELRAVAPSAPRVRAVKPVQ
jgi:integrase